MALSEFEIAMGGIASIPFVGGLIFLGYKSLGESSLDASKLKPKKKSVVNKETPASNKKITKTKGQDLEMSNNSPTTTREETSPSAQPTKVKQETSTPSKKHSEQKLKASTSRTGADEEK